MRLICPNCGATYEVDDSAIPQDGRDVQCSNCAHTWFESPSAPTSEEPFAYEAEPEPVEDDNNFDLYDDLYDDEDDDGNQDQDEPAPPIPTYVQPPEPAAPSESPSAMPRRQLDSSIAEILREEAAREEAARAAETEDPFAEQGDLGLDSAPAPPPQPARPSLRVTPPPKPVVKDDKLSRLRGTPPARPPAGTEVFPDIEEINSTLRTDADRGLSRMMPEDEEDLARESSRRGFFVVIAVFVILMLLYVFADGLATLVPALSGALDAFTAVIDEARLWLDDQMRALADLLGAGTIR